MKDMQDGLKAARKVSYAYEKAVEAAQQVIADGPPRGLGTTVMTGQAVSSFSSMIEVKYSCAECGERRAVKGDKFCPHCGREIMRFVTEPESNTIFVRTSAVPSEPQRAFVVLEAASPESSTKIRRRKRAS